jgi:hypothetical protein
VKIAGAVPRRVIDRSGVSYILQWDSDSVRLRVWLKGLVGILETDMMKKKEVG